MRTEEVVAKTADEAPFSHYIGNHKMAFTVGAAIIAFQVSLETAQSQYSYPM